MIKTHSKSRFQLKTLEEIRDSAEIVLQIEKTDSSFIDSKKDGLSLRSRQSARLQSDTNA